MCSKQPDSMPNTDADAPDAPGALVTDAVVISEAADENTDARATENEAAQSALPASFSRYE